MSTNAAFAANYPHDPVPLHVDYWLLAIISALLHVCAWLWWSRPVVEATAVVPPQAVEIMLVAPRPVQPLPPIVTPAPPPAIVPPPVVPRPPPPKPRPTPITKSEPKPMPPVVMPLPPIPTRPSVAAPAALAPPPEPVLVPASTKATSRRNPKPDYPSIARRRGWEGKVLLSVEVMANGKPGSITVAASSGHEVLDSAAMKAVMRWLFAPARRGDSPVASTLNLSIVFRLEE